MRHTHADPTADKAIANVDRELRRIEREKQRLEQAQARRHAPKVEPESDTTPGVIVWRLAWTDKQGRIG